jgi:siroheme synthase-like protein
MTLLPIFLRLDRRPVLVVGAGTVAVAKVESLRAAGAAITVVAPDAIPPIRELARTDVLLWHQRVFAPQDLEHTFLVIAATNAPEVNRAVYEAARRQNVLCNAVDDPPNCDFYFGSVVSRGDLQVAVSTAGESPALAQRLRKEIDAQLPVDLGPWLSELGALRNEVRSVAPPGEARNLLLHELAQRQICSAPTCPARAFAQEQAEGIQKTEASA